MLKVAQLLYRSVRGSNESAGETTHQSIERHFMLVDDHEGYR